jgi:ABC-type dipeptide/oligopeptide/nickel transport system permease subunit
MPTHDYAKWTLHEATNRVMHRLPIRLRALIFRLNAPLLIGGLLAGTLCVCVVAAPLLAPHDPLAPVTRIGGQLATKAPYPPGTPELPLGSDALSRDQLSRLLYGGRYTLLMCGLIALARVILGTLLGILAGWYAGARRVIGAVASAWSAVPSLFFAFIAIPITANAIQGHPRIDTPITGAIVFTIALSLTGWAETTARTRVAVQGLRAAPFVEAAYAIGLSRWAVLWRHILPNLRDVLLIEAAAALSSALLIVAELGFFSIFIGGGTEDFYGSKYPDPIYAEWGSMLAKGLRQRSLAIWLLIEPLIAFTITILAFNLVAEGLRRRR